MSAYARVSMGIVAFLSFAGVANASTVTIVHVNDSHSHLDAIGPKDRHLDGTLGGLAKAATVIGQLKATEPNALLVHAGDVFQEDVYFQTTFGVAEWQLLRSLGLDVATVGNHEFHLGPDVLTASVSQAFLPDRSPLVAANLDFAQYPALGAWIAPNTIKEVGGVKVGFFGLTTPFDAASQPAPVVIRGGTDPAELLAIAAEQVQSLRARQADVVVCVSHLGLGLDQLLAAGTLGLDAIVGGHDHAVLDPPMMVQNPNGVGIPIVQAGAFYEHVGRLSLSVESGKVAVSGYQLIAVDAGVPRHSTVTDALLPIETETIARFGDVFHTPLALALFDITTTVDRSRPLRDTAMGDLLTDALRWRTNTDIALTVNGFIADGLPRGVIVGRDVFRTVGDGFDPDTGLTFRLFTVDIVGAELAKALETTLELAQSGSDDQFVQVSGMRYAYDSSRSAGQRLVNVRIGARPLDPARTYRATLNAGILYGLPQLGVQVTNVVDTGEDEYFTARDYVSALRLLAYTAQGRIRDVAGEGSR